MPDESRDSGARAQATRSSGPTTLVKVALGCLVLGLVLVGSCVGLVGFGARSVWKATGDEWGQLAALAAKLETDDGARQVWEESPALHPSYPTAEDFVAAATSWRPRLGPIPARPPALWSGRMSMNIKLNNRRKWSGLDYRYENGTWLRTTWEDGTLATIAVE
jgi:hypothetical protein